jgi:hypothetical protein
MMSRRAAATMRARRRSNLWSHHWLNDATREESETVGTFYMHWEPPALYEIETDEGFSLEDLMQARGRLELQAFGYVKHGGVPG